MRYHLQMKQINISYEAAFAIIFLFSHRNFRSVLEIQDSCLTAADYRIISRMTLSLWRDSPTDLCCVPHQHRHCCGPQDDLWNGAISVMFTIVKGCCFFTKIVQLFYPPLLLHLVLSFNQKCKGQLNDFERMNYSFQLKYNLTHNWAVSGVTFRVHHDLSVAFLPFVSHHTHSIKM